MAQKKEVVITCNATNVKAVIEGLERGMAALAKEEEHLLNTIKQRGYAEDSEKKRLKQLENAMDAMRTNIQKNRDEMKKYGEVMKDLAGAKTKELKKALQEGKRALDNMSARDPNRQKLINDLQRIQKQIEANTGAIKKQNSAFGTLGTTMKNLFAYAGIFAGFNKLKSMIEEVFKANTRLSDSLANIRKVSGLTMKDINQLYANIAKIDTRNTIETLNQLAYTGAKLGIAEHGGTQALTGFVKAAEQVQMALGEDLGEEALPALAKLTEVMGLMDRYGVEQAMQKAASSIFQLGATSTATGKNIVEFSKRLMGLANVSRISADELLAIGSAADAMGLMPEVAATAFNKLFTAVQQKHNLIEKTLDLPKGRINYWFEQGKTMEAIVEIFDAMNKRGNMNALDGVFKDLGSDGARLVAVMTTMADRVDILKKHLETSTKAFKEGEAVIGEYMIQNETAAALMERASNMWAKAFTNPEGVTMVQQMAKEWYNLSKEMTNNKNTMAGLKLTIDGIALALRTIIQLAPFLIKAFTWAGVLATIRGIYFGISSLITAIRTATTAAATLQVVLKSNWVLAGVSAVAAVFTMIYENARAAAWAEEEARKKQAELDAQMAKSKETIEQTTRPLERYKASLDKANVSEEERNRLLKEYLAGNYQDYLDYLGIEIDKTLDLAKAYNMVVQTMKQKKAYEEREQYRDTVNGQNRMDRIAAGMEFEREAKRMGLEGVDRQWIAKNQKGTTMDIYMQLMRQRYGDNVKMFNWERLKDVTQVYQGRKTKLGPTKLYGDALGDVDLWNAIVKYQNAYRTERNLNRDVDDMFKDMVGDYDPDKWEKTILEAQLKRKGGLSNEKPDKDAEKALTKAQREEKKALKLEMDQAEKDSTAVINAIEEFYRLQESAVEQLVADGKMTREEADRALNYVKNRKDTMLMNARRAIAGKDSDFEELRKTMGQDMLRPDDQNSQRAMNTVQTIDVAKAAQRLQKFDGSKAVYDLNAGSFTQAMLKNAAQNELNIQRRQAAVQTEIDKLLLQYQYVEQAQRDFGDKLVKMGLITDGYQKVVQQLADGTEIVANTNEVQGFANKVVGLGSQLYGVNPESTDQLKQLMQTTMTTNGTDKESFAAIFPNLDKWLEQPEQYKVEMQAMYELMIQYEGIYYDKLKQRDDLQNKRLDSWWEHSDEKKANDKTMRDIQLYDFQYNTMHEGETMGFMMGLTNDLTHDPEVMREQAILEAKIAIWQKAKEEREANLISEEVYQQKLRDMQDASMAYSQKVMENINKRISRIQAFVKPVETAANTIGKKLGDMIFNMQSEESTWEQIWKNMALAMAESLMTMVGQYATYQIQKAAINKSEVLDEAAKAQAITMLGISSGAAKTIGTLGWWGIALIPVITSLLMGLLTSALSTASSTTSSNNSSSTASAPKTKLVSGMLTYDKGNVQRFIGQDGKVYTATEEPAPRDGLITHPIATTVQGQPALVAEKGPEIVIGRETTKAIMMNEPELIRYLANYQQQGGRRLYDGGNLPASETQATVSGGSAVGAERQALINRLDRSDALMEQVLYFLQNPVAPEIAMYDTGGKKGLHSKMQEANKFMARYGG